MANIWQCLFSPRLYMRYKDGSRGGIYQPETLEKWGDKIITSANTIMKIGLYTSPFICMYIYKRGYTMEQQKSLVTFIAGVGCLIALSYVIRGYGRAKNLKYMQFLNALNSYTTRTGGTIEDIRKYDFEFYAWPVSYQMPLAPPKSYFSWSWMKNSDTDLSFYQRILLQPLAFFVTHTFGIRMIYPGCLSVVRLLMWDHLLQGRIQLVEGFDGNRAKVGTVDGNEIDTMFVDNRSTQKGKTLVICCEGNSGFYEIGIMMTPIKAGYSTLGWNHPGFAGSTGVPYPVQEQNAIDAVMQYAINVLNFNPEDIVLFGWSIGGYAATWTACNYPIKALILDATFDDLLPLAENQMPSSWSLLVKEVVRSYVNLDIATMLKQYEGPVALVRRTEDEIICLRQGDISTNRGNHLAVSIINHRHPGLLEEQKMKDMLNKFTSLREQQRANIYKNDTSENTKDLLRLVSKYMRDYRSTHCTPLPEDQFEAIMDNVSGNVAPSRDNVQSEK